MRYSNIFVIIKNIFQIDRSYQWKYDDCLPRFLKTSSVLTITSPQFQKSAVSQLLIRLLIKIKGIKSITVHSCILQIFHAIITKNFLINVADQINLPK